MKEAETEVESQHSSATSTEDIIRAFYKGARSNDAKSSITADGRSCKES